MKTLELNKMEQIEGGKCTAGLWAAGGAVASTLFLAGAFATGPVGWVALAAFGFGHAYALSNMVSNCGE